MPFHRYITPTYFGGLPVTHDLINVVSGGAGVSDGSALVAPQKSAPHPNQGTYFVAFGEDATSGNANRGFKALSENTDFLDDAVHRDLATPRLTAVVTPGAPVASVVITANVFVGVAGTLDTPENRAGLVVIYDNLNQPLNFNNGSQWVHPVVIKIHDGLAVNVIGQGFYVNPTIDISPPIPAGVSYRISYSVRDNLLSQPSHLGSSLIAGPNGLGSLWAFTRNITFTNQTFLGNNTHSGTNTFTQPVSFLAPGAVVSFFAPVHSYDQIFFEPSANLADDEPRFKFTDPAPAGADEWVQVAEIQLSTYYKRWYLGGGGNAAVTYNARWDATAAEWIPDTLAFPAAMLLDIGGIGGHASFYKTAPPPANWVSASWGIPGDTIRFFGTIIGKSEQAPGLSGVGVAFPTFITGDASLWPDADPDFVMSLGAAVSPLGQARMFHAVERTGLEKNWLLYSRNADWDYATHKWKSDVTTERSVAVGFSKDNGVVVRENDPDTTWDDDQWDTEWSLRGLQRGVWMARATTLGGFVSLAAAPGKRGVREETWIFAVQPVILGQQFSIGSGPSSPGGQQRASSHGAVATVVRWDEKSERFYAICTDNRVNDGGADGLTAPWLHISTLPGFANNLRFGHLPPGPGAGYIASFAGGTNIYESTSMSGPWNVVPPFMSQHGDFICTKTGLWIACGFIDPGETGIFTSTDRVNWTLKPVGGLPFTAVSNGGYNSLAYNPDNNVVIAVGTQDAVDTRILFARSLDGGVTWTRIAKPDIDAHWFRAVGPFQDQATTVNYVNGGFLLSKKGFGGTQMAASDARGDNWASIPTELAAGLTDNFVQVAQYQNQVAWTNRSIAVTTGDHIRYSAILGA